MPPKRERADPITLGEIEQRLGALEANVAEIRQAVADLLTKPHPSCPGPVLTQRMSEYERWQARQNGSLQKLETKTEENATERRRQIEHVREDLTAQVNRLADVIEQRSRQATTVTLSSIAVVSGIITILLKVLGV